MVEEDLLFLAEVCFAYIVYSDHVHLPRRH